MSQPEDTPQQDPNLMMQQTMRHAGDQSNNEDQDVINFPLAIPHYGAPPHGGNACIPGLYGAVDPNQYDTPGQLFFPEAQAPHAGDPNVFPLPNPSIMMAALNGSGHQIGHEPFDFNSYQDSTNGQGTFDLDFEQEALKLQASIPFNSDQAGSSGHTLPFFDADQSAPNGHNPGVVNSDQGDSNSQGPIVFNPYHVDPKGNESLALSSDQTSPDSQGFLPAYSDQARPSIQDQIASISDLSQTPVPDDPTLWRPMTVEDIARNPAATLAYFLNFQNSLQSSHELALDKVQRDYATAFEKVRNDYAMVHEKARNSYAIALQEAQFNTEAYCCKLRAELEYLRSDNAVKTQTIREFRDFLENMNREISHRGLRLSPTRPAMPEASIEP